MNKSAYFLRKNELNEGVFEIKNVYASGDPRNNNDNNNSFFSHTKQTAFKRQCSFTIDGQYQLNIWCVPTYKFTFLIILEEYGKLTNT